MADSAWFSNLLVGGTPAKVKLDTGAEANVLRLSVYAKLRLKSQLSETSIVLSSYEDFKVEHEGTLNLNCEARDMTANLPFFARALLTWLEKSILG